MSGVRHYAIPPHNWTEAEAFQHELQRVQEMLGNRIVGLRSPKNAADFLLTINFRLHRPITEKDIRRWCRTRHFPHVKRVLGEKWYTTSAHVIAWLWTYATYAPLRKRDRNAAA